MKKICKECHGIFDRKVMIECNDSSYVCPTCEKKIK